MSKCYRGVVCGKVRRGKDDSEMMSFDSISEMAASLIFLNVNDEMERIMVVG